MQSSFKDSGSLLQARYAAPGMIAFGLCVLFAHVVFSTLPIAAAFSLIALGAALTPMMRRIHPAVIASHVFVYACLYVLLVGAICDAAVRHSGSGLSTTQIADLGVSAGVMAFVVQLCGAAIIADCKNPVR